MPVERPPETLEHVNMEVEPLQNALDPIRDAYALSLVTTTFNQFETFRVNGHDWRWRLHDRLYWGWVPQQVWDGTNIPRSSLSTKLVFDQVHSALPATCAQLFDIGPEWFDTIPEGGATPEEARAVAANLSYHLNHARNGVRSGALAELKLAIHSILLYGNGGVEIVWDPETNGPKVLSVDLRDFYIDPGCASPDIEDCRAIVRRKFLTVDELEALRGTPGMKIPETAILYHMAKNPMWTAADITKQNQEALRGVPYAPGVSDNLPAPGDKRVEVLAFYSKARIVWVLNRQVVAYNERNNYGFYPFVFAPCYSVPTRFYGQGIADVNDGNQMYLEGLLNGRLDELALAIHSPRILGAGADNHPANQRTYPGVVWRVRDAKDMLLQPPMNATANVAQEMAYIDMLAERRTGLNAGMGGVPRPSNANRTLGGMQLQGQGGMNRLSDIVENIENYLLTPLLYKAYLMTRFHTVPGQVLPAVAEDGQHTGVYSEVFRRPMNFRMTASSRMLSQQKLMSVFPIVAQSIFQGPLVQGLAAQGKKVNFEEVFRMLQDAAGLGKAYEIVSPMTQEELQQMQTPPPEVMADMQKAQQDGQVRLQMGQMKAQTEQMKVQAEMQMEAQRNQPNPMEMMAEQQKVQSQREIAQIKAESEREKLMMLAQKHQLEMQAALAKARVDQQVQVQGAVLKQQTAAQDAQLKQQALVSGHQMDMAHKSDEHAMSMEMKRKEMTLMEKEAAKRPKGKTAAAPKRK